MRVAATRLAANSSHRGFGDQLYDLSGQVPSLDLNFSNTKSLTDSASGRQLVTFTRASSGTYVGSDGLIKTATTNEARFDHNPTTGESLGLLVEESRTNLLLQSEDFATTWPSTALLAFGSGSTVNAIAAPNGTITADLLVENTAASTHNTAQAISFIAGNAYTFSVWVKAFGRNVRLTLPAGAFTNAVSATFNTATGALNATSNSPTSTSATAFSDGWWWFSITATATTTASASLSINLISGNNTVSYTGDGTSGIYLWGAQLEAGAFPTSYIPTTTATVTRSADVASITGTNFSSWYRQDEGTVFTEGSSAWASGNFVGSSDNTNNNRIFIGVASGPASRLLITTSGSTAAAVTVPYTLNTSLRGAGGYKENSSQFAANGVLGTEDTNCTIPTVNRLSIGSNTTSSDFFLNGTIRRLAYFPQRLSNSTLQEITR